MPVGVSNFMDSMALSGEVNLVLHDILAKRYGKAAVNTGDEGGFAPPITEPTEALEQLHLAVEQAGYADLVVYGLDCAASHFYDGERDEYLLAGKPRSREDMITFYEGLASDWASFLSKTRCTRTTSKASPSSRAVSTLRSSATTSS